MSEISEIVRFRVGKISTQVNKDLQAYSTQIVMMAGAYQNSGPVRIFAPRLVGSVRILLVRSVVQILDRI